MHKISASDDNNIIETILDRFGPQEVLHTGKCYLIAMKYIVREGDDILCTPQLVNLRSFATTQMAKSHLFGTDQLLQ